MLDSSHNALLSLSLAGGHDFTIGRRHRRGFQKAKKAQAPGDAAGEFALFTNVQNRYNGQVGAF